MGQPVAVVEKPSSVPGTARFELNRALTGMGHEHYSSAAVATGPTAAAELARRLFATGDVAGVHIYANIVTVDLARGRSSVGLGDVARSLHQYWHPGMEPPTFDDVVEETASAGDAGAASADSGADPALAEAAKRVPMHLLERGRAARERWKAKNV